LELRAADRDRRLGGRRGGEHAECYGDTDQATWDTQFRSDPVWEAAAA